MGLRDSTHTRPTEVEGGATLPSRFALPPAAIQTWPGRFVSPLWEGRFLHATFEEDIRSARLCATVGAGAYVLSLSSELWALGFGDRFYGHVGLRAATVLVCLWFVLGRYPSRNPRSLHRSTLVLEFGLGAVFAATTALSGFSVLVGSVVVTALILVMTQFLPLDPRWTALPLVVAAVLFFIGQSLVGTPVEPALGGVVGLIFAVVAGLGLAQAAALRTARRRAFASIQAERRARRAVERSGRDFRSLFDLAPVPLAISDLVTGTVFTSNRRFDRLFGIPQPRPPIQAHRLYRDPADCEAFLRSARRPGGTEYSFRAQTFDGRPLELTTSAYPLRYEGRASLLLGFTDRTAERRTAEALRVAKDSAEAASRIKTQFLANMSHEIRTPMNGVVAMAGLLASSDLSDDQREMVDALRSSGDALLRIINDILDLSKVEAGELALDDVSFGIRALTRDVHAILRYRVPAGVDLAFVVEPGVPEWLFGDPGRLRQVLMNLAGNALKFTSAGRVEVRLRARTATEDTVRLVGMVEDTGVGIAEADLERLFLPFTQTHPRDITAEGGTGLGLAISKHLVEMMGGVITVESVLGEGSRFSFEVPFARGKPGAPRADRSLRLAGLRRRPCVLVAEDNRVNQMVAQRLLDRLGARWTLACTGREVVEKLRARTYDLVLMDVRMPELDGLEATKWLRRYEAETGNRRTPVVALTAHALSGDRAWCLDAGMDDYLTKPIRPDRLRDVLLRWTALGEAPPAGAAAGAG